MAFTLGLPLALTAAITPLSRAGFQGVTTRHGHIEGTTHSAPVTGGFSINGLEVRCARRRTRRGTEIETRAAADSDTSSAGGGEASGVPSAITPSQNTNPRPASSFTQRVEAAAAALRSGRGSQQRRKPPLTSSDPNVKPPTPATPAVTSSPGRLESRTLPSKMVRSSNNAQTSSSLLSTPENDDQMTASQNRLFEQMVTLRTRLNERLAASNKFAKFLESTLQTRDKDIKHANERLVAFMLEIESLKKIAKDAVDAAEDETQSQEKVAARLDTLTKRLDLMHNALKRDVKDIDAACIKSVPIRWVGMASDIRIMGSFDHWTKGVAMSPEFIEGGNNVFVADLMLVKGTYEIKFVVDGIWQTAPDWATNGEGLDANNILVVE